MKKSPLISVIIPVYNVEKYLDRCIESVVNQTYNNLEIILVDDGSYDKSPQICDDWGNRDHRIKVIHKQNGGLSSARNTGLQIANGEYICFLDSDDWLELDAVEVLYNACFTDNTLLSSCGRYTVSDKRNVDKCFPENQIMNSIEFTKYMLTGKNCDSSAWAKLFHISLWDDINFPEGMIYEDVAIMYRIVLKVDYVSIVKSPLYNYYRHNESITTSDFSSKWFDYTYNTRSLLNDIEINYPCLFEHACWTHVMAIQKVLSKIAETDKAVFKKYKKEVKELSSELRRYKSVWCSSKVFSVKDKLYLFIHSHRFTVRMFYKLKIIIKNCQGK